MSKEDLIKLLVHCQSFDYIYDAIDLATYLLKQGTPKADLIKSLSILLAEIESNPNAPYYDAQVDVVGYLLDCLTCWISPSTNPRLNAFIMYCHSSDDGL